MTKNCLLSLLCLAFVAGCGKSKTKETPAAAAEAEQALTPEQTAQFSAELVMPPRPAGAPSAPELPPTAPIQERLNGALHQGLTLQLRMYIERTGKTPESIAEFANSVVDSMPPAPPGMRYAIDKSDTSVKVVRK